jgi:hypothetical protein
MQGVGFNFPTDGYCYEVCYCDRCGLVSDNGGQTTATCQQCKSRMRYFKDDLRSVNTSNGLSMPDTDYLGRKRKWHCPRCKQSRLSFEELGLWD